MGSQDGSAANFGLFIAYVIPGFIAVGGSPFGAGGVWAGGSCASGQSVPDFLFGTVEAVTAGLTASTVRWLVIDRIHHRTGVRPRRMDFAGLGTGVAAFEALVHAHYHYYQFYANTVVALVWSYAAGGYAGGWRALAAHLLPAVLFFLGSRDALRKYYERVGRLLNPT